MNSSLAAGPPPPAPSSATPEPATPSVTHRRPDARCRDAPYQHPSSTLAGKAEEVAIPGEPGSRRRVLHYIWMGEVCPPSDRGSSGAPPAAIQDKATPLEAKTC
jgi:hypothetical protein